MLSVCDMLTYTAERFPDKYAIVWKEGMCTYRELQNMVDRISDYLIASGHRKGNIFGIYSHKSIYEIAAMFAILKIGGIFVNINPSFKSTQIRHILAECKIKTIFVSNSKEKELQEVIPPHMCVIVYPKHTAYLTDVDAVIIDDLSVSVEAVTQNQISICAEDMATIVYTSGSTGNPKGIVLTHGILSDATIISALALNNTKNDKIISLTPFAFDGALSQLLTSVYVGATLVLQQSMFPNDIVSTLVQQKVTGMHVVPSLLKILMQKHSTFLNRTYSELRYMTVVGEVLDPVSLLRLEEALPDTEIFILYGTTEAFRSTYLSTKRDKEKSRSVGKPFAGVTIAVKNEWGENCAANEEGEIVHYGAFVSPGYWNDPDKTRQVFQGGAVYTGDIGWLDEEGFLYFSGRKDNRIKRLGYRVGLEEIEEQLCQCPAVMEAAVVVKEEDNGLYLKGYLVLEEAVGLNDVKSSIKNHLPYYMIPDELVQIKEMPKTATYKIDRTKFK